MVCYADFEILRQAHVLLGRISIRPTEASDRETNELNKSLKKLPA